MGTGASANQHSSVTIGAGSTSDGVRNITIGPKASASGVDSIAIGNGGVGGDKNNTGVGGNGNTYTIDVNGISTNVYYGVKSVDNGSIAFGNRANAAKGGLAIGTVSIADGGIAVGQSVLSKNGVAIGSAVSATAANAVALGSRAEASSVGAVAIGGYSVTDKTKAQGNNALAIGASAVTNGNETIAIGKSANASNANAVAVGKNAKASIANSVAIGSDSTTDTNATRQANTTINSITYNFAGATSDTGMQVSVGAAGKERQIKNVAAGEVSATSTDAINGSQLFAVASQIKPQLKYVSIKSDTELDNANNDGATADKAIAIGPIAKASSKSAVAIGNTSTASSENAIAIGNNSNSSGVDSVAIGPSSVSNNVGSVAVGKDAKANGAFTVALGGGNWQSKGAQANGVGTIALGTYTRTKENTNYQTAVGFESKTDAESATAIGYKAVASGKDSVALGTGASTTGQDALTFGHNSQANGDSSLAMGIGAQANSNNAIALGYQTNSNSTNSTNGVFIGSVAGKETNGVGNIGIGSNTGNKIIGDNNVSIGTGAGSVTATNVYASESIMLGTQARAINSTSTSPINNVIAIGKGSSGGANSTIAIGQNASSTNQNSIAIGTNASAPAYNGVAIGSFSVANTEGGTVEGYNANASRTDKYAGLTGAVLKGNIGAVSIGSGGTMTRQIKNLAAGTADTDAVNVAQLKSVNLAFKGNAGTGDVNLAANPLTIKGNDSYITTNASGNTITISANQKDIHVISGTANADTGVANAKNVATAINDAISQNKYKWYLTADNDTAGSRSTIDKEGTVKFSGDPNITVARSGNTITSSLNKIITVDTVKASKSVIAGSGNDQITLDGTSGTVKGKTFSGQSFVAGNNVLSNTTLQIGSATNGDNNVTISRDGFSSKAGTKTAKFGATGIDAGGQRITNVSSGGNVGTNAANITDVKNAVSDVTLKLDTNSKTGTVKLSDGSLKIVGANGIRTDLTGTNKDNLVIGLDQNTINATTKGIGLSGDTGTMLKQYLKDGDANYKISGDGALVSTSGTTTGVQVSVDKSKVKDLAVDAVTVSKATNIPDNPITVTPKAGTNSKEYAIGIDTTKLAAKTNLAYTANGATAKTVSLAKGLNFVNGTNTVATVDSDGKVSFDLNQATKDSINKSATAVGRTITLNADSGTGSSQSLSNGNVSFAVSGVTGDYISTTMDGSAVKVSTKRATIDSDTNTGKASVTGADGLATAKNVASAINSAVNGLSQNLNISDGTKDSSVALKSQKLTVTGTGAATTAVNNQTITVDVAEGTLSNNADGTVKADAAGVATTKNVADVINKTISDNQYSWKLSANGEATTATVGKGDTVDFTGDTNITVDRNNKDISIKLNKDLTGLDSVSLGTLGNETIKINGRDGSIKARKAEFLDNVGAGSTITSDQLKFTNGATGANEATTTIALDTVAIQSGPNSSALTSKDLTFSDEDGNIAEGSAKGMGFQNAAGKLVQFTVDEITAGGNKIKEVAEGTADTDAVNVKQLKDTIGGQSLTYRANTSADTDAKSVKLSKGLDFVNGTSTVASVDEDGKVSFDLNTATKTQINTNTTDIATNTANIAHTIALADDNGTSTTAKSLKDGNVSFNIKGDNKFISTAASGNDVTLTVDEQAIKDAAKAASSFKVKANTHAEEEVKGGDTIAFNNGDNIAISQTGKTFTIGTAKNITVDSVTAGNTVINTSGLTNGTTAITGTGVTTDKVTVGGLSIDKTAGINAGGKVISNVASGGTTDSNAANIGDVKQAVANLSQNLNITDGTNNGTVDLKNQKLNVAGANGVTATVNNQTITVGLDADTVNATTKGIGLTADTGSTGNKYLKDGDVSFAVTGDDNLVSTTATTAGVKVAVDTAKVKDLAVAAVTVSKDTQADNPITVTPTAGANSKDYAIGIDTTKLAAKTDLTYRANSTADANAKKVSLSKGLDFVDGDSTVATVDNDGKVSFDLNTATKNQISTNTTNIATNTTDIAANKGNITKNTASIATNTAALARNISLGADTGTASSQSLSTADVAFNVKGATGDFISTNMNGNTVEISTTRATINSNATTGEASVTGNDGLATAKNVADAINKAADAAKAGAAWNITTNSSTTDKTAVKGGDTVDLVNGDNIEITQDGTDKKKITVATKKDITVDSVTANNKVTVGSGANKITLDGTDGSVTGKAFTGTSFTGTSFTAGNTVINTNGLTNGTTAITGTGVTTDNVTVGDISIDKTTGINAGNKVISNVASGGTTLTNAANIGDVQNAVANLSQNLNITDGTHDGTVDLKNQKLNVAGANGVTAIVNNQTITVGLDADTVNATTKGIGLTADTGSTGNKYLKDGDVSFAVTGDGSLVSTSATAAGVKVAVNSATITAGTDGTITGPTTDGVATAKNVADAINAAKKASKTEITANTGEAANATTGNVTLTSTTAADGHTIYDVKLNDKVTLGTGANAVTIDGTTGAITGKTATIGGVTVNGTANTIGGLSNTTWNGTAVSGRAATEDQLKAATGATTLKFTGDVAANTGSVNLKDDTFGIKGDGKYISTDVNGKNVNLTVSEAEVKKSAVAAVTVSTDTTDANNPISVTPTTSADGTTKDYKVTIDGTKIANKTNLSYKANDGTAKQVSLADGLNFKNGTLTTASIDDNGVVKYDVNTAAITTGADGTITGPTTDGVATAKNVADAINAAKKASKTEVTANTGEAANATTGNVSLTSTTAADGHTIYDVKLNDKVTLGTGANAVTIDGTTGAITGKTATIGGVTVNGTANTIGGLSNTTWNGTATTGRAATEDQLKAVADAAGSQTWEITADKKAGTSGAQTGTKENAKVGKDDTVSLIAGENLTVDQTGKNFTYSLNKDLVKMNSATFEATGGKTTVIKGDSIVQTDGANVNTSNATSNTITDGTNTSTITAGKAQIGTVGIDGVASKIATGGANAVVVNGADGTVKTGTVTVTGGTTNDITGLSNTTLTATDFATKGRAATEEQLKAATGATTLKVTGDVATNTGSINLKDDTFGIKGDGKYISTDVNGKNVNLTVSEAEVKKSAVAAVTVSTDTTDANNPLTVTPTTSADGTTKDYKVTIDGTKIANKTNLSYKANDGTAKQVSLADGLNFKNGTLTTASIDDNGVVKYDVNTASIAVGTDGTITGPTTDGVATAQNVTDAINAAKKASKTEITANTGEATNATTGNVTLTSTTAADGHTIYDVKLNDKVTLGTGANAVTVDGTTGKATIGSSTVDGVNNTFTTGGVSPVTLNGATGTITGKTANIGGVTVNGTANIIGGLSNTTWNGTATTGRAATEDQLKAVADAAGSQTWEITADKKTGTSGAQTGTKENAKVGKDDKVSLIAGENLTVDQAGKNFTYSLNTDLVKMNSATFLGTGANTTVITGDSITQTAGTQTNTSTAGGNTVADGTKSTETTADGQVIKDGTKSNKSTVDNNVIDDGNGNVNTSNATSNTITDGTNTTATTSSSVTVKDNAGNSTVITKDNVTTGVGANKITLDGTAGKATIGSSIVDGVNNTFTTGGANAVTMNGAAGTVKTGTVTVTGGTTNDITGLSNTTVNSADFATKGRAATEEQLKAATGATTLKFTGDVATNTGSVNLKDDIFGIKGDGKYISTDVNGKNVNLTVSEAEVKKSAVAAVTVSTDTTDANNPLTVTPTTSADGTTKDYKVTIDGTKIANKTNLSYKANNGTAKQVSLADGLDFTNGTLTTASIDDKGVVKYDVNTASITAGTDGTITGPTTDGVATAKNVADAINAAKKASKTEITANTGEAANATIGNVSLTSTTAADGHTIYDVKLNDKVTLGTGANAVTIDGTAGKAAIGSSIVDGVNNTFTTGGASPVTLNGATGTITGKTANIGGVTVDGTNNHVMGLANKDWTPGVTQAVSGRAATEDQLQKVSDAVGAGWKVNTGKITGSTGESNGAASTKVASGEEVQFQAGNNLIVDQNGKTVAYSLNKALKDLESATFNGTGTNKTVITGDSITQTAGTQTNTSTAGGNTIADGTKSTKTTADGQVIKDGTKTNTSTVDENTIIDGTKSNKSTVDGNTITDGTNTTATTSSSVTVKDNAGNSTIITKDNITTGVGGNKITLDGTAGKATIGSSIVDGVNNTFTTGGTNAVALDGGAGTVKTGTITVTGGTTNDITGLSNTTVTATDFATKGRAATEEQLKAVGEQTWQITADKDATTSGAQTGTKKDAKVGKDDKVQLIAGENMTVNQNERDFTFTLNKDLVKMNSATFLGTGTNTTVITGDSITQTAGIQTNTSTAAGNTVANGANSTATTAAGTTVTTANGNTNYAADGVRINTTGKTPVSLTDAGLDNGNNVIKNVASGHVNNDATDNTNAANIADVKKATTTVTANAGEVANATTGNVTLTSTAAADGHTIYDVKLNDKVTLGTGANAVMIDGTAGKATVGTAVVDGVNNTITTGGASPVTLNGATGTIIGKTANIGGVTVDGTNNHVMGLANKNWTPGVTQAVSGRAATEDQLQKVSDAVGAGWKVNTGKVTGSTGESNGAASTKVASGEEVQFQAGNNLIVDQNGKTVAYSLNKALKDLESATFNGTGTNKTVITGDSITQTAGTQTNTSTAAGNTVADGTKSTKTTADGQVIKDGTKTNTSTVDENTIVDGAKSNKTTVDSNVINDGNGNVNTSNATSNTITDGTNTVATTSSSVTVKDNAGNSTVITKDNITTGVGANKIILDGAAGTIKTGTVTVTGGTTNDITGLSNTTVTATDFATKGRAATEEQLKAVGEQTWQITADKKTGTSGAQTGLKENAKVGKDDKVSLIAGENLTVDQAGKNFTYSLNSDLVKMNSATFLGTGTNTTVITGDSITQTAGSQTNTSTAGGNTVADGTKSTEITAAGQVIKDGAKSNKSTVDKNVIDDGTGNVNTSNATSNTITDGTNTSTIAAGKATIGSSIIDGVNNTFTTGGASPVTLDGATGTITGKTANIGGVTVDGTNNHVMGLANKDWTPGVTQAVSGRAATEDQLQKVSDAVGAGWKVNTGKVTGSTGESNGAASTKVASGEEVQFQAGNNLIVDQNGKTVAYSLNKALKDLESATFNGTGTNKTVINGDSITQTAGTQTNTSTAAGNTVADGTKSTETTAAGQVIKDGAKSNKSTVDNNVIDDGNGNVNTSNATSNTITDGTNTSTVTAGKATIGSSIIDGVNNTFTTGGADAVTLDGATGTITGTTANIGGVTVNGTAKTVNGLSNTTWNGTAVSGRAATEDQLKAVGEQTWQITADKDATTSGAQTGTKKDAKVGKDDKVQLIAGENMTVNQNERDFTFTLNKDLVKMNSATFLGTDTNKTVITGDSITQTAGTQTNTSTAGGNTVADGTKSTKTTADGQVIKDGTKTNTSTVDENTIVDGIKSNKSTVDGNTITDGTNTTETTSSSVTVKDNAGNSTVITKDNITTGVGGNKITLDGTAGKATIGSSIIDGVNKTFTTGGANAVTMDGVAGTIKTGTVTVTGGTTNDITGLSNTTVNSADFATKGRAATEEQLKAVGEQTWQITADKDATTSGAQTGTKKDAKVGKDDKVQLIAGENMTVNQNERDFTFTLNKDLVKMNSATFLGTGSNTTVITGNSITQTAGTQTNTSTAAGNTVADGTKFTETTAAGQVIKDGAKTNKSTVDTNVIDDGNGNKNTSNATSNTITDGTNTSTITAGKANIGNIAVDGVNNKITMGNGGTPVTLDGANGHLDGLTNTTWVPGVTKATTGRAATEDQLQQVSDAVGAGWKVNTGTVAGSSGVSNGATSTKVSSGEEVKLQAGDNLVIDQNGKTVSYSLNKDLTKMNSATFEATGGKTTVIKGDSIVQTDGSKTNTSNAAGNTVVDGNKSTATTAAGTTITDGAKTNTSTADKNVINDGAGNTNTATATSNTLKNAAGDETKADAKGVTVKDAAGNNATFTKDGITITNTSKDTVSLTSNGLDNGKNKIINVADGTNPTDAVNVRQLDAKTKAATTELTANDGQHANSTNGNIMIAKSIDTKDGHTIYDTKLNDKITLGAADPTKAITVDGIAGTIKAGKDGNAVAINGTNGTVKAGDGTNAVAIDGVNGTIAVADKITLNGKDGKAGIGTVGIDGKDGIITTGGTNSVKVDGATGTVTGLTNKTWTPGSIVSGRAATEDQLKDAVADSGWKVAVGKDGSGKSNVVGTSPEKIKAEETVTFKAGNNMMVTQTGKSISYAVNPELTNMTSATFKDAAGNTTVTNGNGITITPGSANPTNPHAGPVSLTKDGLNNGNNQIKGVAPGTDPTDAVNVSQLNASNANTSQAINQVAGEVQRVGAHAAAMAALKPIQYDPLEPTQVMAGVGNYRGETAAALGLAHYTNENTMFNVGVSVGGNHNMVNAGVTHKFGYSPEKKNIPDRYKAGPISSVYVMQDEVSSLKKENAEQKYVIADQAARLTTLEAENEQQRRELEETKKGLDDLKAAVDKLLASKG